MSRWLGIPILIIAAAGLAGALLLAFAAVIVYPTLPSLGALTDYRPKVPLRVYTADGVLIGQFGQERRKVVTLAKVPLLMREAIISAEDERFYQHGGIDYQGVLRAAVANFLAGSKVQGASTITMQVARNFFLSRKKTYTRKFAEALLAMKIEHNLSKDQILQLYINQIYLGHHAYGFEAAAQTYFGKTLDQLNLAEMAVLAGIPRAPSAFNPIASLKHAKQRQEYVLSRMYALHFITRDQLKQARGFPLKVAMAQESSTQLQTHADYVAEMARQEMYERYHDDAYTMGLNVYTTIDSHHQQAAWKALRDGVLAYDRRHGYRGPEGFVQLPEHPTDDQLDDALQDYGDSDNLKVAVVLDASPKQVKAYLKSGAAVEITGKGLKFAARMLGDKVNPKQRVRRGSIIRVEKDAKDAWEIVEMPTVEAALVSMDPQTGAIKSLVGGFDFWRNKYNHVTQALRQPGSSFKPFIYSAALEKGFTPATIIDDAPLVIDAKTTGSEPWEPKNYDGKYDGPMRMRMALAESKNLVTIRIMQSITPQYAQDYITRFGFDPKLNPPYLTLALGAGAVTPWQMVDAYATFDNGGYKVTPYFIERVTDDRGRVLLEAKPQQAGAGAPQIIDPRNAFIMTTMMEDVIRLGTGRRALRLGRKDLAGKTGTTNDWVDAWFCGFQKSLVAVAWMGYDQPHSLGRGETGSHAALPIWMEYMGKVLKGAPEQIPTPPPGVVTAHIDPTTGLRVAQGGIVDYFYQEYLPPLEQPVQPAWPGTPVPPGSQWPAGSTPGAAPAAPPESAKDQLF